jgi:hypothetical protein
VRAQPDRVDLVLALVLDPGLDEVPGEDVALQQELVVLLQVVEHDVERARQLLDLRRLLGGQLVEVLVERLAGSILFCTPSSPAITQAANDRYGLQVGSGVRNSSRFAFSELEYIGMRTAAERLRALYARLIGAS